VHPDQAGRQPVEVLDVPDHALQADQPEQRPAQPDGGSRGAGQPQSRRERDGEPAEQPADVRVELGRPGQREIEPGHRARTGQRPGAGHHGPGGEHQRHRGHHAVAEQPQVGPDQRPGRCQALGAADVQRDRGGENRDRRQEVQRHHARVELGQHHDAAEHGLGEDPGGLGGGEPDQVPPPAAAGPEPPRGDEHHHGDQRDGDGDQAVAELDPGVEHRVARRMRGDQAAAGALGPVRAAQAGLAEPDRRAGRDDAGGADHPGEREGPHGGRRGIQHGRGRAPRERPGSRAWALAVRDLLGHGPMVLGGVAGPASRVRGGGAG